MVAATQMPGAAILQAAVTALVNQGSQEMALPVLVSKEFIYGLVI